jgi:hypothetical protein
MQQLDILKASHYCKDILNLDEQIYCVTISDAKGGITSIDWKREKVPWEGNGIEAKKTFEDIQTKLGLWGQIILGLAEQTAPLIGTFERATFVHKKYQLVLLGSETGSSTIGLMLSRSANVEHVISQVKDLVGFT